MNTTPRVTSPLPVLLRTLVCQWVEHRRAAGSAPRTLESAEHCLRRFVEWVGLEKPNLTALAVIDRQVLADYAVWLAVFETEEGRRLKAKTRQLHLVMVRSFFAWLARESKVLRDPARHLPLPKVPDSLPRGILTVKEVERVLAAPDLKSRLGLRDRAILELFYSSALRNSELCALELNDLNLAEGLLSVRRGKGGKGRTLPIGRIAVQFLQRYLEAGRPRLARSRFEEHLFLSTRGHALTRDAICELMSRAASRARFKKRVTAHGLRHTCATHLLKGHADIRYIQELLGHRKLSTTQIYTHVAGLDLKRTHARCHPRERRRR